MAKKEMKANKEKKHYWKEFKAELKKVIWPTPKQLLNNTAVVVALVLITALIVFVLDVCFDSVNKYGITKLQASLQNSVSSEENAEENSAEEDVEESSEETPQNKDSNEENVENTASETDEGQATEKQETTESNE